MNECSKTLRSRNLFPAIGPASRQGLSDPAASRYPAVTRVHSPTERTLGSGSSPFVSDRRRSHRDGGRRLGIVV